MSLFEDSAAADVVLASASGSFSARRAVGILFASPPASRCISGDDAGTLLFRNELVAGVSKINISVLPPSTDDHLFASCAWKSLWPLASKDTRIVLAALPSDTLHAAVAALKALGRHVSWHGMFDTYQLPLNKWVSLCGDFGDSSSPLNVDDVNTALSVPPGYTLGSLVPADAALVNSHWEYAHGDETALMMQEEIRRLPSACIRPTGAPSSSSSEPAAPVSWAMMRYDGSFGILHTEKAQRGQGLARKTMSFLCILLRRWVDALNKQAAAGLPHGGLDSVRVSALLPLLRPYAFVSATNESSIAVLKSVGMQCVDMVAWVESNSLLPRFNLRALRPNDPSEWADLVALVNMSYKQDDAFFVDQWRSAQDGSELRAMGADGLFIVGYRIEESAVDSDASTLGLDHVASGITLQLTDKPAIETAELLVCFYIRSSHMPAVSRGSALGSRRDSVPLPLVHDCVAATDSGLRSVASLSLLTVNTSLKKLGVAQRLLDAVLGLAKGPLRCDAVECYVVSVKPWLLRFYERNGFEVVGTEPWPAELDHQLILPCYFHRCLKRLLL